MEKNLYEVMIQQSPVSSIVFEIIKSGEAVPSNVAIFDANPAFERLSGVSRDKIVRKLISEIDLEICNRWFDWIVNDIKNTSLLILYRAFPCFTPSNESSKIE